MEDDGRKRVVIENLNPEIDGGRFPIKRVVGEKVVVTADIFADGHDAISARLLYRAPKGQAWEGTPMRLVENDRWRGEFAVKEIGIYHYTIEGWVDHFKTWQRDLKKKWDAGHDVKVDLLIGAGHAEETSQRASAGDRKKLIQAAEVLKGKTNIEKIVSLLSWEVAKQLFGWYVLHLGRFSMVYGSLGTLSIFFLWIYYSSAVLILGGEVAFLLEKKSDRICG